MSQENKVGWKQFVLRVEFIPYVVFTIIGLSVAYFVGGIALGALRNGSLIPPPTKLETYTCNGAATPFSIMYLHGTDRVQIKSASGQLDGTVNHNRFDWNGFANDRNVLGFAPPADIVFEDAKTLRVSGPDLRNVDCAKATAKTSPGTTP